MVISLDVIGPEKAEFICELLGEVGRKDLTVIVKEYIDKVDRKFMCVCGEDLLPERGRKEV